MAAVLLAYIPRLPSSDRSGGLGLSGGSVRITPGTNRRLRIFATTQIACTFVLLAGAGMLVATLTALQTANTGYELSDRSWRSTFREYSLQACGTDGGEGKPSGKPPADSASCQAWKAVAMGGGVPWGSVPWRDRGNTKLQFVAEGYQPAYGEESPDWRLRNVTTRYLAVLGVPILAGRVLHDDDLAVGKPWPLSTRAWPSGCSRTVTRSTGV